MKTESLLGLPVSKDHLKQCIREETERFYGRGGTINTSPETKVERRRELREDREFPAAQGLHEWKNW